MSKPTNKRFSVKSYINMYGFAKVRQLLGCSNDWLKTHIDYDIEIDHNGIISYSKRSI